MQGDHHPTAIRLKELLRGHAKERAYGQEVAALGDLAVGPRNERLPADTELLSNSSLGEIRFLDQLLEFSYPILSDSSAAHCL